MLINSATEVIMKEDINKWQWILGQWHVYIK